MDKQLIERIVLEVAKAVSPSIISELSNAQIKATGIIEICTTFLARIDAERGKESVAWFAFADNNGPVPLELWGFDKKECKHAVLESARSVGWKGTIEGYLLHMRWAIRPLFLSAPTIPEGMALVPIEPTQAMVAAAMKATLSGGGRQQYEAMLAAAQGERNAD